MIVCCQSARARTLSAYLASSELLYMSCSLLRVSVHGSCSVSAGQPRVVAPAGALQLPGPFMDSINFKCTHVNLSNLFGLFGQAFSVSAQDKWKGGRDEIVRERRCCSQVYS
jgi:hypothetical protein